MNGLSLLFVIANLLLVCRAAGYIKQIFILQKKILDLEIFIQEKCWNSATLVLCGKQNDSWISLFFKGVILTWLKSTEILPAGACNHAHN